MSAPAIILDTSFLITYASSGRPNHAIARQYFDAMIRAGAPMLVPTIVVAEFERRQSLASLGLNNFRILPFNHDDAIESAKVAEFLKPAVADKLCLVADYKIIAQAHRAGVKAILTEDASTLAAFLAQLRAAGHSNVHALLLSAGFDPSALADPAAPGLPFGP